MINDSLINDKSKLLHAQLTNSDYVYELKSATNNFNQILSDLLKEDNGVSSDEINQLKQDYVANGKVISYYASSASSATNANTKAIICTVEMMTSYNDTEEDQLNNKISLADNSTDALIQSQRNPTTLYVWNTDSESDNTGLNPSDQTPLSYSVFPSNDTPTPSSAPAPSSLVPSSSSAPSSSFSIPPTHRRQQGRIGETIEDPHGNVITAKVLHGPIGSMFIPYAPYNKYTIVKGGNVHTYRSHPQHIIIKLMDRSGD